MVSLFQMLRKKWANAEERWDSLSRNFERKQIIYNHGRRIVYLPEAEGREHFPIDDKEKLLMAFKTAGDIVDMVETGLVTRNQGLFAIFEKVREPSPLSGVVLTRREISGAKLIDLEQMYGELS